MWYEEVVWVATSCLTEGCLRVTLNRGPRMMNDLRNVCAYVLHVGTS